MHLSAVSRPTAIRLILQLNTVRRASHLIQVPFTVGSLPAAALAALMTEHLLVGLLVSLLSRRNSRYPIGYRAMGRQSLRKMLPDHNGCWQPRLVLPSVPVQPVIRTWLLIGMDRAFGMGQSIAHSESVQRCAGRSNVCHAARRSIVASWQARQSPGRTERSRSDHQPSRSSFVCPVSALTSGAI